MIKQILSISLLIIITCTTAFAQKNAAQIFPDSLIKPRMRIIIDNDFGGDPDGLFELVQHLLSPSVEIRAIYRLAFKPGDGFDPSKETATHAKQKIEEVLSIMNLGNQYPVYAGTNFPLENDSTAQRSDAANAIVKEAMRDDTKLPLYVVCGAGLTDLASAYLLEPKIANRLTLVWIGGPELQTLLRLLRVTQALSIIWV
jgi:inosine-uridine nucleoside N-ribohydrolase